MAESEDEAHKLLERAKRYNQTEILMMQTFIVLLVQEEGTNSIYFVLMHLSLHLRQF